MFSPHMVSFPEGLGSSVKKMCMTLKMNHAEVRARARVEANFEIYLCYGVLRVINWITEKIRQTLMKETTLSKTDPPG